MSSDQLPSTLPYTSVSNLTVFRVVQEVNILNLLGFHPNINRLVYWSQSDTSSFIFLDMCYGGTLQDHVLSLGGYPENQAAAYMVKLLETTSFMHSKGLARSVFSKDFSPLHQTGRRNNQNTMQVSCIMISSQTTSFWLESMT